MKFLGLLLVFFALSASAQNPYSAAVYDSLVIYDYGNMDVKSNIKKSGKYYTFYTAPAKSIKLSKTEAKEFSDKIALASSYTDVTDDCYDPHFAALYYKGGKAFGYIEVCMDCSNAKASFELPGAGFLAPLKKYLKALLVKYNFSHIPN